MNNLLKLAQEFESELKKVDDLGDNLFISPPLVKDLVESLERTKANLDRCIPKIKSGTEIPQNLIEEIRNFSGNLALLCNMILNGKSYSKEETTKAISDDF